MVRRRESFPPPARWLSAATAKSSETIVRGRGIAEDRRVLLRFADSRLTADAYGPRGKRGTDGLDPVGLRVFVEQRKLVLTQQQAPSGLEYCIGEHLPKAAMLSIPELDKEVATHQIAPALLVEPALG